MIDAMRTTALVALALIGALHVAWHAWLLPPARVPVAVALAIALVPLVPLLFALAQPRRALIIGATACLLYFTHGVMEAWASSAARPLALIEVLLSLYVIVALGVATFAEKTARRRTAATAAAAPASGLPDDAAKG